jgi:hypothetical protein
MNRRVVLALASLAIGCATAPSDPTLKIEWEVRSHNRADLAQKGFTDITNKYMASGGTGNNVIQSTDGYFVATDFLSVMERATHRYVVFDDRSTNAVAYVFEVKVPETVVWCSDWTSWSNALAIPQENGLNLRLMKSGATDADRGNQTAKLQFRYRVSSWNEKCKDPASAAGRRMPLE